MPRKREEPKRTTKLEVKELVAYLNEHHSDARIVIEKKMPTPSDPEKAFRANLRSPEGIAGLVHFLNTWEHIPRMFRADYRARANEEFARFRYIYRMDDENGRAALRILPVDGPESSAERMLEIVHDLHVAHDLHRVRLCRCGTWFFASNERRRFHDEKCRFAARKALLEMKKG